MEGFQAWGGDLNPGTGEIYLITDLNSKTGEESLDRGSHAAMVVGAPPSELRPADRGASADAGWGEPGSRHGR
jgi:hypothetical protein